jgi:hypothetical protein
MISELSSQFNVHPNQISKWKAVLLDNMEVLFRDGRLEMENDFLKKVPKNHQIAIDSYIYAHYSKRQATDFRTAVPVFTGVLLRVRYFFSKKSKNVS